MRNQQRKEEMIKELERKINRIKDNRRRIILIDSWEKSVVAGREKVMRKAEESKKKAIRGINMFGAMYVLEDDKGKAYDEERLEQMSHQELIDLLEFYLEELSKDVGGER